MRRLRLSSTTLAAALILASVSAPGHAAIVDVTWTGTISGGTDGLALFGLAGADLTGASYTAYYQFDTSLGYFAINPGVKTDTYGGTAFGLATPSLATTMTINGHAFSFIGSYRSEIRAGVGTPYGDNNEYHYSEYVLNDGVVATDYEMTNIANQTGYGTTLPWDNTAPFDGAVPAGYGGTSDFTAHTYTFATSQYLLTSLVLVPTHLTIATAAATEAPEPASLAIIGFSLVGLRLARARSFRRR